MTLEQFLAQDTNVSQMRSLQATDFWKTVESVLMDAHPCRKDSSAWNQEQRAAWQARTAGYEQALNVFELMVTVVPTKKVPQSSYQPAPKDT